MPFNQLHEDGAWAEVLAEVERFPGIPALAGKFLPVDRVRALYRRVRHSPEGFGLDNLLAQMRVELRVDAVDTARIPATGPVVVVANHPFGMLDGAALAVLLTRVRPDVKVMTNYLLRDVPELARHCIFVDPFQSDRAVRGNSIDVNQRAVREALDWLRAGGMLAIFPAGEVSHWQFPHAEIADPAWSETAVRLMRRTGAAALPVYFCGRNSVSFHLFGMIHPRLRTAFLLQEFLQQEGRTVEVRVGSEVPGDAVASLAENREAIEYLRWRTYLLARRSRVEKSWPAALQSKIAEKVQEPVAPAEPAETLAAELSRLAPPLPGAKRRSGGLPGRRQTKRRGCCRSWDGCAKSRSAWLARARGKAVTSTASTATTGMCCCGTRRNKSLWAVTAPAARLKFSRSGAWAASIPARCFVTMLGCLKRSGPALELGRSFVRPEYQRQYAPLLLLWKGIARLLATHAETPVLFGAVSISNDYSKASREMIYRFFEERVRDDELAGLIEPRRPFRPAGLRPWDCRAMCHALRDLEELSQPITDVEADGKGLPILLRQYAKIGGKMVGFNVDRRFSNVLDGLVVVDLRKTESGRAGTLHGTRSCGAIQATPRAVESETRGYFMGFSLVASLVQDARLRGVF